MNKAIEITPVTLVIAHYQYRENYGAHTWDGEGACPQYWKNKGGHEEVIHEGEPLVGAVDAIMTQKGLDWARDNCDHYNEYLFRRIETHTIDAGEMLRFVEHMRECAKDEYWGADLFNARYSYQDGERMFDRLLLIAVKQGLIKATGFTEYPTHVAYHHTGDTGYEVLV